MPYTFIAIPLIVGFVAQFVKFLWRSRNGHIAWNAFNSYGGMPSTHTAITTSLVTVVGIQNGIDTMEFAIALFFTLIVIRDAIGFRQYLSAHSKALNRLVSDLPGDEQVGFQYYRERIGHTPAEAFAGAVLGIGLGALLTVLL